MCRQGPSRRGLIAELLDRLKTALADRYRVERELGHGGMATVYLAEDVKHHRWVAVKVLRAEIAAVLGAERFLREIETVARLNHPNILPLHDSGEADSFAYYVMPYVEGESLRDRLKRETQLPLVDALQIAREVADALSYAHSHDVVHRDIKPENILIGAGHAVVSDFGIARAISAAGGEKLTATGLAVGTPAYMSPEQMAGGEHVDGRTDVYSLGCVLYEMLAGEPPFTGSTAQVIQARKLTDPVPRLRTVRETVPDVIDQAITKALAKNPADRFATAHQFAEALERGHSLGATPGAESPTAPAAPTPRHRLARTAAVAATVVALAAAIWWAVHTFRARGEVAWERIHSIAVLPLTNLSGDPSQEYFADGMTEELTTTLGKIEALRVIAHQSVLQFKHSDRSVPEIARLLDVKHVVDGSVLQDGDRLRITATLIDAETNMSVWGESFERERRDVMALQREVALAIAAAIEMAVTPQDLRRLDRAPVVDPEAFELYLKGTQARYRTTEQGFRQAAAYFARAVARDSGYAPAYAGLASAYTFLGDRSRAELFADKALKLDASLAETYVALGMIRQFYYWDWAGAENALRQAIGLNPGYAEAHHELSMLLMRQRRFDEAMREAQLTLYLAPMSARFMSGVAEIQVFSGRYDEALSTAQKTLALDSSSDYAGWVHLMQSLAYVGQARYEDAVQAEKASIPWGYPGSGRAYLAYISAVSGRREEALKVLEKSEARWRRGNRGVHDFTPYGIAMVYAGLGDREKALDWLERADVATPSPFFEGLYLGIDPRLRSLHAEPRFRALLKKVGLQE